MGVDASLRNAATQAAAVVRFAAPAARLLAGDDRRIIIIGASGWIGRSAAEMLRAELGDRGFARRVACFGSSARELAFADGTAFAQAPLGEISALPPRPSMVLHLAFLTKDKAAAMTEDAYIAANRQISDRVVEALDTIGADRLFLASSGAAAFADDPASAPDLRLYGRLKRDDEARFAAWAEAGAGRHAVMARLHALSGPFINKPETYALADLILAALGGQAIKVRAPVPVLRSYVAVREVLSLVIARLLASSCAAVTRFDTGGEPLELGTLAQRIADLLGGHAEQRPISGGAANRYLGDHARWLALLAEHGLEHLPIGEQIAETAAWLDCERTAT